MIKKFLSQYKDQNKMVAASREKQLIGHKRKRKISEKQVLKVQSEKTDEERDSDIVIKRIKHEENVEEAKELYLKIQMPLPVKNVDNKESERSLN
tara:strand:- start:117 stop:401 length:285 start_codon:yes stop_codon:yes gene_type:complete